MPTQNDATWHGAYKIPWEDPDFSRRMLAEHLSQDHDLTELLTEAGFHAAVSCEQWPCNTDTLRLWTARK